MTTNRSNRIDDVFAERDDDPTPPPVPSRRNRLANLLLIGGAAACILAIGLLVGVLVSQRNKGGDAKQDRLPAHAPAFQGLIELDQAFWRDYPELPLKTWQALRPQGPHLFKNLVCQLSEIRVNLEEVEFAVSLMECDDQGAILSGVLGYANRVDKEGRAVLAVLQDGKPHMCRAVLEYRKNIAGLERVAVLHLWTTDQMAAELKKYEELERRGGR